MAKKRKTWTPEEILDLRTRLRLSQASAAAKVGVSRRAWAYWEAGQKSPSRPVKLLLQQLDDSLKR